MTKKIDTRESIRVVTSNNFLKASGLDDISLKAKKLLYLALAQSRQTDETFYTYKIKASEFAEFMGIETINIYQEADKITDELMKGFVKIVPEGKKKFKKFKLFSTIEYDNGEITFELSRQMTPIVLNLKKNFTQPLLNDFARMKSGYSMSIWHLFQREMKSKKPYGMNVIEFELTLDELRMATETQNKFERLSQFKEKVLDKAIREIYDNCGVKITYTYIKRERKVVGFHFVAVTKFYIPPEQMTLEMYEKMNRIKNSQ